jgi:hypothetical protein
MHSSVQKHSLLIYSLNIVHVGAKLDRDQNFIQISSKYHSNMFLKKNQNIPVHLAISARRPILLRARAQPAVQPWKKAWPANAAQQTRPRASLSISWPSSEHTAVLRSVAQHWRQQRNLAKPNAILAHYFAVALPAHQAPTWA